MKLTCIHNAGLCSCMTIRLLDIIRFYNEHASLPDKVDSSQQFAWYKDFPEQDLTPLLFLDIQEDFNYARLPFISSIPISLTDLPGEVTFGDYSRLNFNLIKPFIQRYFTPSELIQQRAILDWSCFEFAPSNTCAVFYRGNDKHRECAIEAYSSYIAEAWVLKLQNKNLRFLVLPDELEFQNAFLEAFPDSIILTEAIYKEDGLVVNHCAPGWKTEHAFRFLLAIWIAAQCKYLITHSGNGSFWAVLYRGNMEGVKQFIPSWNQYAQ